MTNDDKDSIDWKARICTSIRFALRCALCVTLRHSVFYASDILFLHVFCTPSVLSVLEMCTGVLEYPYLDVNTISHSTSSLQ